MRLSRSLILALGAALLAGVGARADTIRHPAAVFVGLDKITGRIITFDVAIDETVQFGTLQITPRVCLTRPQTEAPLTEGFVEVDEIDAGRPDAVKTAKRIFSGWMFAASPGLHGVEHPVYDVWLKDCKGGTEVTASPANAKPDVNAPPPANAAPPPKDGAAAKQPRRTIEPQEPVEPTMENLPPTGADTPPPAAPDTPAGQPASPDGDLGAPIDVGPPPGGALRGNTQPDSDGRPAPRGQADPNLRDPAFDAPADADAGAPPPKPAKPKRKPPRDPNAVPGGAGAPQAQPQQPPPSRQESQPSGPQDLINKLPFFH
jgi:hypothetical protein